MAIKKKKNYREVLYELQKQAVTNNVKVSNDDLVKEAQKKALAIDMSPVSQLNIKSGSNARLKQTQRLSQSKNKKSSYTNITKPSSSTQLYDLDTLNTRKKQLEDELMTLQKTGEKNEWWSDDRNLIENILNVPYKLFLEQDELVGADLEKKKKLEKELLSIQDQIDNYKAANTELDALDKIGYTFLGNFQSAGKGIESTITKILGGTPENVNASLEEKLAQKARQETDGIAGIGLDVLGSGARMLPQMMFGGGGAASLPIAFANYGGGAYNEARREGYTDEQATRYGVTIGTLETTLEKLLGGFESIYGKSAMSNVTNKIMGKVISNQAFRKTVSGMAGEFTEEYLQEFLQPIVRNVILEEENGADFWNTMEEDFGEGLKQLSSQFFNEDNLKAGITGGITSGIVGAPSNYNAYVYNKTTGRDLDTGYTQNEQSVIDKEVANRVAEAEKNGTKLTNKQKNEIVHEVQEDFKKGYVSTDTIESTLGGDTYTQLQSIRDNKTSIEQEISELENKPYAEMTVKENERLKALREELGTIDTNTLETQLHSEIGQKISSDDYLKNTYAEKVKRGQQFTYDSSKVTNEYEKAVYDSASRVMNDTRRTHEFVEPVAKIAKDRGIAYEFTNNAELESSKYNVKGKIVDGLLAIEQDGKQKILINVDSPKALNTVVGHETTHLLEGLDTEYKDLQSTIFELAKQKGEYEARRTRIEQLYEGVDNADIDSELTADLVGDYLFTDEAFINNLSTQKPTLFQKIKDLIDDLIVRFKGTKEERQLREVQKRFKEAYRKNAKDTNVRTKDAKYSLSEELYNKVKNEKQLIHVTQDLLELVNSEKVRSGFAVQFQNKGSRPAPYKNGVEGVEFVPEFLEYIDKTRLFKGDGASQREGISKEKSDRFATIEELINDDASKRFGKYNEIDLKDDIAIEDFAKLIKRVSIPKNSSQELINRLNELGIEIEYNNLTRSNATKYSLSDNQGRTLTKEQQEFFKDSKVRDEEGNLLEVYHVSNANFNEFKGSNISIWDSNGFVRTESNGLSYFTSNKDYIKGIENNIKKGKMDNRNYGEKTRKTKTYNVYLNMTKPLDLREYKSATVGEWKNILNEKGLELSLEQISDYSVFNLKYDPKAINYNTPFYRIIKNASMEFTNELKKAGYDGIIFNDPLSEASIENSITYVATSSNQIKNVDNTNPTSDADIRYSLSVDDYGMSHRPSTDYGDASNFEENMPDVFEHPEWYMFGGDGWYKKAYKESWNALKKVRNNPDGEITIYRATIGDTFNEGDWVSPSKAYAEWHNYSNLEGKGKVIELKVKAKDIRFAGDDLNEFGYFPNGVNEYSLSNFNEQRAEAKGNYNVYGEDVKLQQAIAPLQEQVDEFAAVTEEQLPMLEEFYNESFKSIDDSIAPVEDVENSVDNVSNSNIAESVKEEYLAITPEKEPRLKRVNDNPTYNQIAEVLVNEPKTESDRNKRKWAIFKANILDKGAVFEDLSLKENNRELMGKWDYTLTSEARGQYVIGNGHDGLSKSLNDIRAEVDNTGLTKEFYNYMYHKHNVDRMSLATRFEGMENKPVFGDSVTSEQSQAIVNQYEKTHPEFMDFAQDVYDYVNADRQQLVDNGVISQETADLWSEMYPHYVPTRRTTDTGMDINVPLDTRRTGINAPIKKATGGSSDILPLFDTMAMRTLQTYKATAKNNFGVELMNTLGTTIESAETNVDEVIDSIDAQDGLLQEGKKGKNPTFTVFENGEKVTFEITKDMYDALKPISESSILSKTFLPTNIAGNIHRGLLTEYNPTFMLTNAIKDVQDVLLNSQHAAKTYAKIPEAYKQIATKGYWYQEYIRNGGEQNSYFDNESNTFKTENKGLKKLLDLPPLSTISKINNFIEMSPRLAEYIASREAGRSIEVSMLDAARVTTNFKAGGAVTKWANRNGATFLNASVQGAMQQIRNIREAKANGLKGWVNLATKFAIAGLPAMILNNLVWDDDEEYDELSDYVKQNYYIIGKNDDGTFIRIPKGRTVAVIQEGLNQMGNLITGDDEADLKSFIDLTLNNLAPNNPIENNVFSPIIQAATNKTWYGGDLVSSRLQKLPTAEQYDESTDAFSRWLGEKLDISPVKINYVLDQYSGGIGDIFLPMMTPEAEADGDSVMDYAIAPLRSKFTTNSIMNNQNISDFYDTSDKLTIDANKTNASDEDVLKNKYMNSIKAEMNKLYQEKREVQNDTSLSNSEKYQKVLEIQKQINELSKEGLSEYSNVSSNSNYATVGDREYYKKINSEGEVEWTKVDDDEAKDLNGLGMSRNAKNTYFKTKTEINESIKDVDDADAKKTQVIDSLLATDLNNKQKAYLYGKYYSSDETLDKVTSSGIAFDNYLTYQKDTLYLDSTEAKVEHLYKSKYSDEAKTVLYETSVLSGFDNEDKYKDYKIAKATGVDINSWLSYKKQEFVADKDSDGKSISGSRKEKIVSYINSLDLSIPQKAILIRQEYPTYDDYNYQIIKYIGNLDISYEEKVTILEGLDMKVDSNGNVTWE